jgi:hypothetical protein
MIEKQSMRGTLQRLLSTQERNKDIKETNQPATIGWMAPKVFAGKYLSWYLRQ